MDSQHVIARPLHTEKSVTDIRFDNIYHFEVHSRATKSMVRAAVEELFDGVKVQGVRTMWVRGKSRRARQRPTKPRRWKKAIVKLRPGDTIDIGY